MNLTLSIEERVAENARAAARKMGKSLNQSLLRREWPANCSR